MKCTRSCCRQTACKLPVCYSFSGRFSKQKSLYLITTDPFLFQVFGFFVGKLSIQCSPKFKWHIRKGRDLCKLTNSEFENILPPFVIFISRASSDFLSFLRIVLHFNPVKPSGNYMPQQLNSLQICVLYFCAPYYSQCKQRIFS